MLLAAGCASKEFALSREAPCFTAEDCVSGFICISEDCVLNETVGPEVVHVEVGPPSGTPYTRTQFLDARATGGTLRLTLPQPTEFNATVSNGANRIGATLAVFGSPRIPDREVELTQQLNATPSILRLLPGTYSVRLVPDDHDLPGFEASDFVVRNNDTRQAKDFNVPLEYRRLEGAVVSSVAGSSTIAGVLVRAVGQKSGLPSTEALTSEGGRFSLKLPDTSDTQFFLTARLASSIGPSWYFEQLVKVEAENREKQIELEPTNPALRGRVTLRLIGQGANGPQPIVDATVVLTASAASELDTRTYRISGVTDDQGLVAAVVEGVSVTELPILAERYNVEVETSQQSEFASTVAILDLSDARGILVAEQMTLNLRTQVVGSIASASGARIGGALVDMIPLDERGRTVDTETESDGSFVVAVDPGSYLIVIRPPRLVAGELLPVHAYEAQIGFGERFDLRQIDLPVGSEVAGTVRGEGAGAIAGARVEFFIRQADRTISIARTITDGNGNYSVVLPNPR